MAHHFAQRSSHEKVSLKKSHHKEKMGPSKHPNSPDPVLKRSFSTPDAAKLEREAAEEARSQQTSAAEKKRNKLGYHRTSIACSHCRRRKIRCIASPDTPNRCVNCIRLKKECSFYPVDQQPGPEPRSKAASRQSGDPGASSTSSSPAVGTGSPVDTPPSTLKSVFPSSASQGHADCFSDASVSPNGLSAGSRYTFTSPPTTGWVPTDMTPVGVAKPDEIPMPWHAYPTEPSMSGQFSPYHQASSASVAWTSGTSEAGSHDEIAWGDFPNPIRSLSYSGESPDSHPQGPFMSLNQAHQAQSYERRQASLSDIYSPYPATMAGVPSHSMAVVGSGGGGGPTPVIHAAPFASGVNPWQHQSQQQQMLAAQDHQHATWQYGGVPDGSQPMLIDEQRMSGVTQAPSSVYYST